MIKNCASWNTYTMYEIATSSHLEHIVDGQYTFKLIWFTFFHVTAKWNEWFLNEIKIKNKEGPLFYFKKL